MSESEHRETYKGRTIVVRLHQGGAAAMPERAAEERAESELLIDDEPVRYGQLPGGDYFLHDYAYDWHDNLMDVARRFIDHQDRADEIRRESAPGGGE